MKLEKMAAELIRAREQGSESLLLHDHGRARDIRRTKCSWPVQVLHVDLEDRTVYVSWNHNPPTWWSEKNACKLRTQKYGEGE